MKKYFFLLVGFVLLFASCENNMQPDLMPDPKDDIKIETRFRISVDDAINNVNSLLDIIDNNNTGNGNMVTMNAKAKRTIKDVNVVTSKAKNTGLMLMSSTAGNSSATGDTLYYIINFENDAGFAFASADERYGSVFCLTENGNYYDGNSIDNPGFAHFMTGLELYIDSINNVMRIPPLDCPDCLIDIDTSGISYIGNWEYVSSVPSKITVNWGQGTPYNNNCPAKDVGVGNKPAGCVATAIAQIFSYYQYPTSHTKNGVTFNYNWATMKMHYSVYNPYPLAYTSLSHLFYNDIGLGVSMSYGDDGSSAYDSNARTYVAIRGGYTCTNLLTYNHSDVLAAINQNKLLYTRGQNLSSAHAWVIDGYLTQKRLIIEDGRSYYEYQNVVHCNWGWDGIYNGYFNSGAFAVNGTHFNYQSKMIIINKN